jgi:hypothetical protein
LGVIYPDKQSPQWGFCAHFSEKSNPKTGDPLQIAASKSPTFKAGKKLKEVLNP